MASEDLAVVDAVSKLAFETTNHRRQPAIELW
jgi:hypothetical protein